MATSVNSGPDELNALIEEIRNRVSARHPQHSAPGEIPLPDLVPLLHARDTAEGKVASIGSVNPRAPGLLNSIIQSVKRLVARALDWHVREQIEFNRATVQCVQAALEVLSETNRALSLLAGRVHDEGGQRRAQSREFQDVRLHWIQWREEWERKLSDTEIHFLRSLSDLQSAWLHRVTLIDETHKEQMKSLHRDFESALDRSSADVQKRLWADLERIRAEYESIIHHELRLMRQKASLRQAGQTLLAAGSSAAGEQFSVDWLKFSEKFRGSEEYVKRHLNIYAEKFAGCAGVLDIGCGRGELLEVFRDAGIAATGIDLNPDCIAMCRSKGLAVEEADLFSYLAGLPDRSLSGIVSLQVVEHLPPSRLPELIALAHTKLRSGALIAIETPNPECLAIFARHFYLDPTHAKPIPPALLAFYLEESGFGMLETARLEPAAESMPSLASLPEDFRSDFFGSLDYAVFGRKL